LRIAKPMLLVSTPIGVIWGVIEAYRFHPWLAVLMVLLLGVISAFIGYTVRVIRRERASESDNQHPEQQP
jgi:membrane protein implicated in regulation of membrane protease activity